MNLQTNIPLQVIPNNQIDYNSKVVLLGSCFAENIAEKFNYYKFQYTVNPLGILFHPLAIETLIKKALTDQIFTDKDVVFNNEQFHCLNAHSIFSNHSKEELLSTLNDTIVDAKLKLKSASHIIITLGTAWIYRFLENQQVVANCHKIPQKNFKKELLSPVQIEKSLQSLVSLISLVNPKAQFIFTVSPVRHIKDGFIENTRSKSHLITAIHEFLSKNQESKKHNLNYFPSYEIMMDELRDYRFYNQDMLHPSPLAVDYIWDKFLNVWISSEAKPTMEEVEAIQKGLSHKPFNASSEAHQQFLLQLKKRKETLKKSFPFIDFY